MEIQAISSASFAIFLNEEELAARHLVPEAITKSDAEAILRGALLKMQYKHLEKVCIELFPGKKEVLLFVKLNTQSPVFIVFDDIESVISAAAECSDFPPASFVCIDATYILTVYPWEHDTAVPTLLEFGEKLPVKPEYELYLYEHGEKIIETDAISRLKHFFSTKTKT